MQSDTCNGPSEGDLIQHQGETAPPIVRASVDLFPFLLLYPPVLRVQPFPIIVARDH